MDVTLVPQAARSRRTAEAGCCELVAHAARRALLFPRSVPLFGGVFLLVLRSMMMGDDDDDRDGGGDAATDSMLSLWSSTSLAQNRNVKKAGG